MTLASYVLTATLGFILGATVALAFRRKLVAFANWIEERFL